MDDVGRIGKRVAFAGYTGTVRYSGKLLHDPGNAKIDPNDTWLGVEWDNPERGNHDGTVKGVEYFRCRKGGKAGSLIRLAKVEPSSDIIEAYVKKYFRDDDANSILKNKASIIDVLIQLSNNTACEHTDIGIEYDDEAVFKTSFAYKKIEFLGFDKIWHIMTNVKKLEHLSLTEFRIDEIGEPGQLAALFQSLRELSIESNLMNTWEEVGKLAAELPALEALWLNKNRLRFEDEVIAERKAFADRFSLPFDSFGDAKPKAPRSFDNLKLVALSKMQLNFETVSSISAMFPNIEELVLSDNCCSDFDQLKLNDGVFKELRRIDLSNNNIKDSQGLSALAALKLEKLNLAYNQLASIPSGKDFPQLTHLNVSNNSISTIDFFQAVAEYPNLVSIRVMDNPILQLHDKVHVRLVLIATALKLKALNGSEIKREERRDAEIYFLNYVFHEYFAESRTTPFTYDFDKFLEFASERYPLVPYYLKKSGNPYPVEERNYQPGIKPSFVAGKTVAANAKTSKFVSIKFFKLESNSEVLIVQKKMPKSIDVGYVKTFVKNFMKLKKQVFWLYSVESGCEKLLENDLCKVEDICEESMLKIRVYW